MVSSSVPSPSDAYEKLLSISIQCEQFIDKAPAGGKREDRLGALLIASFEKGAIEEKPKSLRGWGSVSRFFKKVFDFKSKEVKLFDLESNLAYLDKLLVNAQKATLKDQKNVLKNMSEGDKEFLEKKEFSDNPSLVISKFVDDLKFKIDHAKTMPQAKKAKLQKQLQHIVEVSAEITGKRDIKTLTHKAQNDLKALSSRLDAIDKKKDILSEKKQEEIDSLHDKIAENKEKLSEIQDQIAQNPSSEELKKLTTTLINISEEIKALSLKLSDIEQKIEKRHVKGKEEVKARAVTVGKEIEEISPALTAITEKKELLTKEIQEEISLLTEQVAQNQERINQVIKNPPDTHTLRDYLELMRTVNTLSSETRINFEKVKDIQTKIQEVQGALPKMQEKIDGYEKKIDGLLNTVPLEQVNDNIAELRQEGIKLVQELKENKTASESTIDVLLQKVQNAEDKLSDMEKKLPSTRAKINRYFGHADGIMKKIEENTAGSDERALVAADLRRECATASKEISSTLGNDTNLLQLQILSKQLELETWDVNAAISIVKFQGENHSLFDPNTVTMGNAPERMHAVLMAYQPILKDIHDRRAALQKAFPDNEEMTKTFDKFEERCNELVLNEAKKFLSPICDKLQSEQLNLIESIETTQNFRQVQDNIIFSINDFMQIRKGLHPDLCALFDDRLSQWSLHLAEKLQEKQVEIIDQTFESLESFKAELDQMSTLDIEILKLELEEMTYQIQESTKETLESPGYKKLHEVGSASAFGKLFTVVMENNTKSSEKNLNLLSRQLEAVNAKINERAGSSEEKEVARKVAKETFTERKEKARQEFEKQLKMLQKGELNEIPEGEAEEPIDEAELISEHKAKVAEQKAIAERIVGPVAAKGGTQTFHGHVYNNCTFYGSAPGPASTVNNVFQGLAPKLGMAAVLVANALIMGSLSLPGALALGLGYLIIPAITQGLASRIPVVGSVMGPVAYFVSAALWAGYGTNVVSGIETGVSVAYQGYMTTMSTLQAIRSTLDSIQGTLATLANPSEWMGGALGGATHAPTEGTTEAAAPTPPPEPPPGPGILKEGGIAPESVEITQLPWAGRAFTISAMAPYVFQVINAMVARSSQPSYGKGF